MLKIRQCNPYQTTKDTQVYSELLFAQVNIFTIQSTSHIVFLGKKPQPISVFIRNACL